MPPVEQIFTVAAAQYLAGVEEMVTATDELAASIDLAAEASARLDTAGVGGDAAAASDDAAANAAKGLADADLEVAAATDEEAAAMERLLAFTDSVAAASAADSAAMRELSAAIDSTVAACDEAAVAIDRETVALKEAGDAAEGTEGKTAAFGSGSKIAFLAVAAGIAYSVVKAAEFQSQMTKLMTQAGVAKGQFKELSQGVLELAASTGNSPDSLAQALYHVESNFASVGITAPKALSLVKIAAEGARVGNANLVDVTNTLDATVASGIPGVKNYSQAMGMLNSIVGQGDMTMQDLADSMSTGVVPVVKGYGLTLTDVGAALDTFGDLNVRGAHAGTELRMAVQALADPVTTAAAQLAKLGMNTTQMGADMEHGGLLKALDDLQSHLTKAGYTAKTEGDAITQIFGKKAGTGLALLMENLDRVRSKYPKLVEGADDFGKAWDTTQKTLSQQWAEMRQGLDALAISFGTVLLPAVTKIIGYFAKFFTYIEAHPLLAKFAGALAALAVTLGLVSGAMAAVEAVSGAFIPALIIAAVVALAYGLYELYEHSKLVRDIVADLGKFFASAWQVAVRAAGAVITWFVNGPLAFIKQQIAAFTKWWQQNHVEIEEVTKAAWSIISGLIRAAWDLIYPFIKVGLDVLTATWTTAWDLVRDVVRTVWDTMAAIIRTVLAEMRDAIAVILDVITGHWSAAWQNLKKLASDAIHGVLSIVGALLGGFVSTMVDLGRNLILGFIHGIEDMAGAVASAAENIAKSAISAVKSALGSLSPSKKAHYEGQMFGQGLVEGMDSWQGHVAASAGRLAGAMTAGAHGAVTGASGAAGGGASSVVINVSVPGGFIGNEQQLATALQPVMIKAAQQWSRRNVSNGLALTSR
jgi:TP901 family phage tail tape measure protein